MFKITESSVEPIVFHLTLWKSNFIPLYTWEGMRMGDILNSPCLMIRKLHGISKVEVAVRGLAYILFRFKCF